MKLKAIIFIALFVVLTHQLTLDEQLDKAREAEHKALGELKLQYENAKEQFKNAFHKLKGDADTSDSDITIQKGITDAETGDDSTKAGEWRAVSALKAQAQKAKEAYKSAMSIEHQYIDELKLKAKNAKGQFKAAFNKARGVTASDSSDAEIQEGINTAESASDTAKAEEWRGVSGLKAQYQKAKEAYKTAKADLKSKIGSLSEEALGAEHKALSELKNQAKNAKEQFKAAFKKIRGNRDSSDSSDDDSLIQKGIETAETAQDVAKSDEWKAVRELKAQYQKAKELYVSSKENLKAKFTKTSESSDSSSDSSDSSDADIDKSKWGQEWAIITQLKNQAKRAKQSAKDAYNRLKGLYRRGSDSSSSSSDSSDSAVKEKVVEKIEEKAVEEAQSLLEQAKNAQITAYLELKEGAKRAKDIFKSTYRDLKAKIRGEKAQPQVDPDL